jgi:DNA-binding XRE family transcriptional regulator
VGDPLLLKRIRANLFQPEVALKAGVLEQTVRACEQDKLRPTEIQWQVLADILHLDCMFPKS